MELNVTGMHCASCETIISESLEAAGAKEVKADHARGIVVVHGLPREKAKAIIMMEGYEVD